MASSVDGYAKLVNGAAEFAAKEGQQVYIGRRTGQVIRINARKDSCGFDRIEDYFPDSGDCLTSRNRRFYIFYSVIPSTATTYSDSQNSVNSVVTSCTMEFGFSLPPVTNKKESDDEENKSTRNVQPVKLKPNQYIGRRTGNVIEINARKDSHGFELIEDYFPDSIRECDESIFSNKDVSNASKLSASVNMSGRSKKNQEEESVEDKENRTPLLNSGKQSHTCSFSKEDKDIASPLQKELDISANLTGTAVKNSDVSGEPSPQFFGSKKRLFPSVENNGITRETNTEAEEDVDVVGVSDEERETNAQSGDKRKKEAEDGIAIVGVSDEEENTKNRQNARVQKEKNNFHEESEDSIVLDVVGGDTPCITLLDKSRGPKVKGVAQKDEEDLDRKTEDDTLIVDIEDDNTFLTLGNKSKVSKLKSMSHDDVVPDNEYSYQMDESVVLEGTRHKAMSPDFGSVSDHSSGNSKAENDVTKDRVKPKRRQTRTSKKSISKKSFREQEQEDDENEDNDADGSVGRQVDNASIKPAAKEATRSSKKAVSKKSIKEEQDEGQENITVNMTSADQTNEDDMGHVSPERKATRKSKRSNKSMKEKDEENNQEDDFVDITTDQTNEDDMAHVNMMKKATRNSKKSVSNKSIKEKEEEENQEDISANVHGTDQANEDDTVHVSPVKKATRNSKKSVSNKSIKEKKEEENQEDISANVNGTDQVNEDDTVHVSPVKKATRNSKKSVSNKSIKEKEEEENQEDISANINGTDQANEDDTVHVSPVKKATRNSKKSLSNKSIKEKEEEENQEDISANVNGTDQANEDDTVHVSPVKKATRNSKKSVSNKSIKEQKMEEVENSEMAEKIKANHETRDERRGKTRAAKRSNRNSQKEQDSDITTAAVEEKKEEPGERIKTRRATRSNTSNLANMTNTGLNDKTINRKNGKKALLGRSTRSKSKSMALDKSSNSVFEESKNEKNESQNKRMGGVMGGVEVEGSDVENGCQGEDDGNISVPVDMEDGMPEDIDCRENDIDIHGHTQGGEECVGALKERARKRQSTRNKTQVNDKSESETEELQEAECHNDGSYDAHGDNEKESQEILKKPAKNTKRAKGKKRESKGAAWRAMLNNSDDDDDHDAKEGNKDQDDNVNNSKIMSKNANKTSKGNKKNTSSSSASESDKDGVGEKNQISKRKRKAMKKVVITNLSRRKPNRTNSETTGSDVTDQEGTADEVKDVTKEDESRPNDTPLRETADKTMNKPLGKRANQTRIESLRSSETSTPVGSPHILPPGSVKSILKSTVPRTMSADAKKPRVSIAANQKDLTSGADVDEDGGGRSRSPGRRRKSSVSFAPTPSFRIEPDDFSTPEESPNELAQFSFVTNYSGFSVGNNTFTPGVISSTSLSSSAASHASVSDLGLSDASSVNESQEITISSAKKRQVQEEEGQDDSGVRRSKRTKVPPLEYWKNERIKYERRQSGWFVSGIEKAPTPNFPKRKSKKRRKEKKRGSRNSDSYEEANDFHGQDEPEDMEEVTYTSIPVINPDNGEQVELDLVHTPQMSNFVNVSGKTATREDLLIVDKFMSHNLFGAGQIVLRPGAMKGKQHVRDDTMVFFVVKGRVEVTVHESTVLLPTGSTFFVPTGNFYNIKNVQNSDARLMFVQIKG